MVPGPKPAQSQPADETALIERARQTLEANWRGRFTTPSQSLYPHQWSWDAAFIAIAYAHLDQERAERELRNLFSGQWANGLLPHIVFDPDSDAAYFPGPDVWQTHRSPFAPTSPPTSGIVQPPNHATAALHLYRHARDQSRARAFLVELFPKLRAWHDYLYRERDPHDEGLVAIRHPWESGQDNSPLWDAALERIALEPGDVPPYRRVDLDSVPADERPTDAQYDRYLYLVKFFAERNYDEARILAETPFVIQDVLFNTLLVQAERDLGSIAGILGLPSERFEARAERTKAAMNAKLWSEAGSIYLDYDLVADEPIGVHVGPGFTPLYAGIPDRRQAEKMLAYMSSSCFCKLDDRCYSLPSYDRSRPDYSPKRYWRGPVWININWLIYHGLRRYGFDLYAQRVRNAILELPAKSGFFEYFDADSGAGYGAENFSWTAALLLDVLHHPEEA